MAIFCKKYPTALMVFNRIFAKNNGEHPQGCRCMHSAAHRQPPYTPFILTTGQVVAVRTKTKTLWKINPKPTAAHHARLHVCSVLVHYLGTELRSSDQQCQCDRQELQ